MFWERTNPTQLECLGRRKYAEVVVQTYSGEQLAAAGCDECCSGEPSRDCSTQPTTSGSSMSSKAGSEPLDSDKITFFSGNPFVEKTTGLLHLYKRSDNVHSGDCSMLCMISVPALVTLQDLVKFVSPSSSTISWMKVVRDQMPNQYMVVINFKSSESALDFFNEYNGVAFNAIASDKCSLVFVEKIETVREGEGGSLPVEALTELPTCAVCLERMDDDVLTILCNHTFHSQCLEQWADTTCPVCRYDQTPEVTSDQKCFDCGKTTDLWICLICGNIGCGRYADAHAYRHFETTSHTFTMQIGGGRVWDYAGDNYVHRLIQNSVDGKMVEFQGRAANGIEVPWEEKKEAIQLEYTCLLTSQLENQRQYFESKLRELEQRSEKFEAFTNAQMENVNEQVKQLNAECAETKKQLLESTQAKQSLERKLQSSQAKLTKATAELAEETSMNKLLRADQEKWTSKITELTEKNRSLQAHYSSKVEDLKEQVRDLMMHFEAQNKFQESVKTEKVSEQELQEGTLRVESNSPVKTRRRSKK